MTAAGPARFIVLTGLSGSGKSQAIRALEDLGYFCVDNLPTTLIPTLADLVRREGISRVAIVVDVYLDKGGYDPAWHLDLNASVEEQDHYACTLTTDA